jgi:hypothetical protein
MMRGQDHLGGMCRPAEEGVSIRRGGAKTSQLENGQVTEPPEEAPSRSAAAAAEAARGG